MREKNEYQIKAAELTREILHVRSMVVETEPYDKFNNGYLRTDKVNVCMVNGIKYVAAVDMHPDMVTSFKTIFKKGILQEADVYRFSDGNRLRCYLTLEKAISIADRLIKEMNSATFAFYNNQIWPAIRAAQKAQPEDLKVPENVFNRSIKAYRERMDLIQKGNEQMRKERRQEELEERLGRINVEKDDLKSLVERIEAMGWHVTLTLKNND